MHIRWIKVKVYSPNSCLCFQNTFSAKVSQGTMYRGDGEFDTFSCWKIKKSLFLTFVSWHCCCDFFWKYCFFKMKVVYLQLNVLESIGRHLNHHFIFAMKRLQTVFSIQAQLTEAKYLLRIYRCGCKYPHPWQGIGKLWE